MNSPGRSIGYQPALDGLRGLLVVGIFLFHNEFDWAAGGPLTLSTFYTLSGFLICSLLLNEHERSGTIDLKAFWARRFRRLMPAAIVTLGGIVIFGITIATSSQLRDLPGDIVAALAYVANWRFILEDRSYADLFGSASPALHFWSLAIEEQFYLFFPLITFGALRAVGGDRRKLLGVYAGLIAAGLAATVVQTQGAGFNHDAVYYGTHTRAPELLMGAIAAVWYSMVRRDDPRQRLTFRLVGGGALVLMGVLWATFDPNSDWIYRGGLTPYAMLSSAAVLAAVQPTGGVRSVLSFEPLRRLGEVSYGAYLFHWPVILWLTEARTELDPAPLALLRFVVTVALAFTSAILIEQPIRAGKVLRRPEHVLAVATVSAAMVLVAARFAIPTAPDSIYDTPPPVPPPIPNATLDLQDQLGIKREAVFGDSTALPIGLGIGQWQRAHAPQWYEARGEATFGCGIMGRSQIQFRGGVSDQAQECADWQAKWADAVAKERPHVAIVQLGPWDVCDRLFPDQQAWLRPGDPLYDERLRAAMLDAIDILSANGAKVVWLTAPHFDSGYEDGERVRGPFPESEPARIDRLNELLRELPELRPGKVAIVEFAEWLQGQPGGEMNPEWRKDLTHFEPDVAAEIAKSWLGDEIVRAYASLGGVLPEPSLTVDNVPPQVLGPGFLIENLPPVVPATTPTPPP